MLENLKFEIPSAGAFASCTPRLVEDDMFLIVLQTRSSARSTQLYHGAFRIARLGIQNLATAVLAPAVLVLIHFIGQWHCWQEMFLFRTCLPIVLQWKWQLLYIHPPDLSIQMNQLPPKALGRRHFRPAGTTRIRRLSHLQRSGCRTLDCPEQTSPETGSLLGCGRASTSECSKLLALKLNELLLPIHLYDQGHH